MILQPETAGRIEHIQAESEQMKQLVESLLTLARSDSSHGTAIYQELDFSYIVNSSILTFEPFIFDMGKRLSCEAEQTVRVKGDEKKLRQLVDILLDNACKYGADGSLITISLQRYGARDAALTVISEGVPLTKDEQKHIFLRFYQTDPVRSGISGYGLGLSIAESIVYEHSGGIRRNQQKPFYCSAAMYTPIDIPFSAPQ